MGILSCNSLIVHSQTAAELQLTGTDQKIRECTGVMDTHYHSYISIHHTTKKGIWTFPTGPRKSVTRRNQTSCSLQGSSIRCDICCETVIKAASSPGSDEATPPWHVSYQSLPYNSMPYQLKWPHQLGVHNSNYIPICNVGYSKVFSDFCNEKIPANKWREFVLISFWLER